MKTRGENIVVETDFESKLEIGWAVAGGRILKMEGGRLTTTPSSGLNSALKSSND